MMKIVPVTELNKITAENKVDILKGRNSVVIIVVLVEAEVLS